MKMDPSPGAARKIYTPTLALAELQAQHDTLREMMDRCTELADELDGHRIDPLLLTREIAHLRVAFETHNAFEEQLLRPVLLDSDDFAEVRIDRMVTDHVGEHRAIRAQLDATQTSELRDTIETLRAHLDAEDRYLLSARVLRNDPIKLPDGD